MDTLDLRTHAGWGFPIKQIRKYIHLKELSSEMDPVEGEINR
jgi:hypothetical protein